MPEHPDETQLAAFVLGELTGESERSQTPLEAPVEDHLRTCAQCQAAVTRLREVVAVSDRVAGRAITQEELSKAHEALLERLRREMIPVDRPARRRFRPLLRWLAPSLAAAAVCVTLAVLVIPRSTAQVALADIQRALEQVPWVRLTGHLRRLRAGQTSPEEQEGEIWYGFNPMREAQRAKDGGVSFSDASEERTYRYDPKTDTVTVRYRPERPYDQVRSPMEGFTWILGLAPLVDWALIGQVREEREGRSVEVLTFERADETKAYVRGVDKQRFVVVCDSSTHLPIEVSTIGWRNGQVVLEASGIVDYPPSGPTGIYDLGVPRTAKVVERLAPPEILQVLDKVDWHRQRFGPTYDALIYVHSRYRDEEGDIETFLFHLRKDHDRTRLDCYEHLALGEAAVLDEEGRVQPRPDDPAAIKAWLTPARFFWVKLYDGTRSYARGGWGGRSEEVTAVRQSQILRAPTHLEGLAWPPPLGVRAPYWHLRPSTDAHSELICLEHKDQFNLHRLLDGKVVRVREARSERVHINPERDYIVERRERESRFGDGEQDPDSGHVVERLSEGMPEDSLRVRTVVEYARTDAGQWYPRKIRERRFSFGKAGELVRQEPEEFWYVHLETPASIPDEVFDPESLGPTTEE